MMEYILILSVINVLIGAIIIMKMEDKNEQ